MSPAGIVAIVCLAILFYSYIGYGVVVWLITSGRNRAGGAKQVVSLPPVTLIISAFNERDILPLKVANCFSLDYEKDKLQIIFVTDGSTDGSEKLLQQYPGITLLHKPERNGKYDAIKRAMASARHPVVVFSDCNAMLNAKCLQYIVPHFNDPKTGAVSGEKKVQSPSGSSVGQAEGLYWKYESMMKKLDAGLFTVVGAAGELFAIRASLFRPVEKQVILDDFFISMQTCLLGYRIAYEPAAFASEPPSISLKEEEKRKVRIAAGACQSLGLLTGGLNFFKHPVLAFQYFSRRVLRWVACPLSLFILIIASCYGTFAEGSAFCFWLLLAQGLFYLAALAGLILARQGKSTGVLTIPFYFLFMNWCMLRGFVRFLSGKQTVLWERSVREVMG